MITKKRIGLILGPLSFLLIQLFIEPEGLSSEGNSVLAITSWIAIWWISEAIPIEATSLLPIILFPLLGVLGLKETGAAYGHKFIFYLLEDLFLPLPLRSGNCIKELR